MRYIVWASICIRGKDRIGALKGNSTRQESERERESRVRVCACNVYSESGDRLACIRRAFSRGGVNDQSGAAAGGRGRLLSSQVIAQQAPRCLLRNRSYDSYRCGGMMGIFR